MESRQQTFDLYAFHYLIKPVCLEDVTEVLPFILLSIRIFRLLSAFTRIETETISLTPLFFDARGWDIYVLENGNHRDISTKEITKLENGRVFYLSRVLTKEQESAGYTFLQLELLRPWAVFVDGELIYTNCPFNNMKMDAVLQNYAAKCLEQHIELICHIGIGEHELPATELCLILNNALENAMEGALTMPEGEKIISAGCGTQERLYGLPCSGWVFCAGCDIWVGLTAYFFKFSISDRFLLPHYFKCAKI